MKEKVAKTLKYSFWAVLAIVLLYFCFRGIDWAELWDVLKRCRWAFVIAAMLCGVASFIFRALRWRLLLAAEEPATRRIDCYDGFTIGRMCDFVIPHVGEFVRCGYVTKGRLTYDKALGTVVLERAWDILMLFLLIAALLVCRWAEFGGFFIERILTPAAQRLDISLWWLLAIIVAAIAAVVAIIFALRNKSRICRSVADFCKGIAQGFSSCIRMPRKGLFFVLTVLLWLMFLLMSWFIIKAIPDDLGLTLVDALFIMLVGSVAGIVPVPGGFGAFHYLVAIALQTIYGIPFETGIIFATLSHESQAVTMALCGAASYFHQTFIKTKK